MIDAAQADTMRRREAEALRAELAGVRDDADAANMQLVHAIAALRLSAESVHDAYHVNDGTDWRKCERAYCTRIQAALRNAGDELAAEPTEVEGNLLVYLADAADLLQRAQGILVPGGVTEAVEDKAEELFEAIGDFFAGIPEGVLP